MRSRRPPKERLVRQTPQQRYRAKQLEEGIAQINIRVPEDLGKAIKRFAERLREEEETVSTAFEKAFPSAAKAIKKRHKTKH
jgi:hypothetical protein